MDSNLISMFSSRKRYLKALMPIVFIIVSDTLLASTAPVQLGKVNWPWLDTTPSIRLVAGTEGGAFEYIDGKMQYAGMDAEQAALGSEKQDGEIVPRKDWLEFTPVFENNVDSIIEAEQGRTYRDRVQLDSEHFFDYEILSKVLVGLFLLAMLVLAWNRRLSNEIDKRAEVGESLTSLHHQLQQANKEMISYIEIIDRHVITSSTDIKGFITSASEAFCEISGYTEEELIGNTHGILCHEDMPREVYHQLWNALLHGAEWEGELKNKKKDGSFYWVHVYISPVFDDQGNTTGFTSIRENITDRKRAEALAITDELTLVFNRRYFNETLPPELARAEREHKCLALMMIDVDYFKRYNDNYGHHEGDKALQAVGRVLRGSVCRAGDFAFRIGGEEFAVVVAVDRCEDAYWIAEKIRRGVEDLKLEHGYSKVSPYLTISVGVKTYQGSGVETPDMKLMYRLADDALYEAKENGRNQVAGDESSQRIVQVNVGSVGS